MSARVSTVGLGEHRGRPRLYFQGHWLARAAFAQGAAIAVDFGERQVTIRLETTGERHVSGKRGIPVIDLNTAELERALGGAKVLQVVCAAGQITITPARTAAKQATRCRNGCEGALFAGAGFLSEAARQAGFAPAFAVEREERYAELYERNHPGARMFNMDIAQVPLDELPEVELLTIGIPCEPFSTKRRDHEGGVPEDHDLGDMVFWALRIIDHLNPATVVIEEVPGFLTAGAGFILRRALERMGYYVTPAVVDSTDYGALTRRKRAVVVATSDRPAVLPEKEPRTRRLGEILDPAADGWFDRNSKPWPFEHWDRCKAKGSNFDNQKFDADSPAIGAVSKRYFNGQGDGPTVRHPTLPDTYRWFTLDEVKRLHGVPDTYYVGDTKTGAGEVLGQGVVVTTFAKIIKAVARS